MVSESEEIRLPLGQIVPTRPFLVGRRWARYQETEWRQCWILAVRSCLKNLGALVGTCGSRWTDGSTAVGGKASKTSTQIRTVWQRKKRTEQQKALFDGKMTGTHDGDGGWGSEVMNLLVRCAQRWRGLIRAPQRSLVRCPLRYTRTPSEKISTLSFCSAIENGSFSPGALSIFQKISK